MEGTGGDVGDGGDGGGGGDGGVRSSVYWFAASVAVHVCIGLPHLLQCIVLP